MHNQILMLLRNELNKAVRRKLPIFGLFAVALLCGLVFVVADQLSAAASANAWGYTAFSMQLVFADIGLIFIIVFSAMLMAEETGTGTIRAALAAPVHRWELYVAKAITGVFYMMLLTVFAFICSALLALVHFRFGPIGDTMGIIYDRPAVLRAYAFGLILSWIPLGALVMYGLFISTLIRSSGAAVAVGISTLYLVDFTKHLVGLDPYIFTKYMGYSWLVLQQMAQGIDYRWQPEIWKMFGLSGFCGAVAFALGLLIFQKRDLNH